MSSFTIASAIIVIAAVIGYFFKKNAELAGVGRNVKAGSLRAPHGRLVRTKRLDTLEDIGFGKKFIRVFVFSSMPTVVILILCFAQVLSVNGALATGLDIVLVIAITVAVTQSDVGVWHPLGYSIVGYLVFAFGSIAVSTLAFGGDMAAHVSAINAIAMAAGTVGSAAAVSWMPLIRTYAREFEDGFVAAIQVSSRSAAARAFEEVVDPKWKPPADCAEKGKYAEDPRAYHEKKYREKK